MNEQDFYCHYSGLPSPMAYAKNNTENANQDEDTDRIIEMAWEDRTPFDAIFTQFGLKEDQVKQLMRRALKPASYRRWRSRVEGRGTKHRCKSMFTKGRFKSGRQRQISNNSISKRKSR